MRNMIRSGFLWRGAIAFVTLLPGAFSTAARRRIPPPPPGGWKPPKVHLKLWNDPDSMLPGEPLIVEITIENDTDEDNVGLEAYWKDHVLLQFKRATKWQNAFPTRLLRLMGPAPPIKIPPHQRIVFRDMVRTWDYNFYWLRKPIFTPGRWKIRFQINAMGGGGLTNEIEINVTFKTGERQDEEAFEYMFGGKEKHPWYCVNENQELYKEYPAYLAKKKEEIIGFIKRFPYSRCARYARLKYVALTREDTDPETVRRRKKYIKYLRDTHFRTNPKFPPWVAKYYLPKNDPFLAEPAPGK